LRIIKWITQRILIYFNIFLFRLSLINLFFSTHFN
ncbi:cytochrome C assembly protein, partial [Staphylococcus capitis]